jgi:hypothetical protein
MKILKKVLGVFLIIAAVCGIAGFCSQAAGDTFWGGIKDAMMVIGGLIGILLFISLVAWCFYEPNNNC